MRAHLPTARCPCLLLPQVVETVAGAQMCVKYLRDNNLGVATFIILDKIQALKEFMERKVNIPAGTKRLFDLVQMQDSK